MEKENSIVTMNNESNMMEFEIEDIKKKIYTIRGKQVMLDSDVAKLYKYETKNVNKTMKRNIDRFPEDFCFQITEEEKKALRFQNGTLELQNGKGQHTKYLPYAYTEQGIAMLSGLLKNEIATQVSINIMRAFIEMRKFLTSNNSSILKLDIQKFNKEYPILKVAITNKFHDRFIIVDNKELYHCGASLKDLGKKCFAISKIEDNSILNSISQKVL